MKLRLLTGLACVLALGGCATYGYVDDGGGYYTGGSSTQYVYPAYGYGAYGYGAPYYRYSPGLSFGIGYGGGYGYGYPYDRPPYHYHSRPPYHYPPPRPGHDGRPDHNGGPDHRPPPVSDRNPPPLDRGPWRDLERLRRGEGAEGMPPRQPRPGTLGIGSRSPIATPAGRPDRGDARPMPPQGYRVTDPRSGATADNQVRVARPQPRAERSIQPSAPRVSESRGSNRSRTATRDTDEP
jgi:hypothetical protein